MTLGQTIGIIKQTLKVSQSKGGPSEQITINIDFSTATDEDIKAWLGSNRAIAGQRPWRRLSIEDIKGLNGNTFIAQSIGQKVESREDRIQRLMNSFGIGEEAATFAFDNPGTFESIINEVKAKSELKKDSNY